MRDLLYCAPCHFGLESVLRREIADLGLETARVEDGKVFFRGSEKDAARANIRLRTAERVLLVVSEFEARSFDELFEKTKALDWKSFLPKDARFWVAKANSVKSALFSPSDIQSIVKKAIVESMKVRYGTDVIPETGTDHPLRLSLLKDRVTVALDTTGVSLHKRGYRTDTVKAPIEETLAAALIGLTPWKGERPFADPFCGSGTFPIEAAMKALGIAPGLERSFMAEAWPEMIPKKLWYEAATEAMDLATPDVRTDIEASDIDPVCLRMAEANAERAGVRDRIRFSVRDVKDFRSDRSYGFMVTNPPYGERISEKAELPGLYKSLGDAFRTLDNWSLYVITPYEDAEKTIGRKASKNRKIYNGMMKTYFYSFEGPKPPKGAF